MANAPRRRAARPLTGDDLHSTMELSDAEPGAAEQPVPRPSAIKTVWLRAAIVLPGETEAWNDCKIYVCPEGLYVYRTVPADDWTPDWFAPMPPQPRPLTGAMARNGINLATERGAVSITPSGACSCSAPLKRWTPQFASRMVRWEA